jgi:hypothetical protein
MMPASDARLLSGSGPPEAFSAPTRQPSRSDMRIILVGSLLSVVGQAFVYVMPGLLASLASGLGLSAVQLGRISGFETLCILVSAMITGMQIRRFTLPVIVVVLVASILGAATLPFAGSYEQVLAIRGLTGLLGEGPAYALGFAVLARSRRPDRAFGVAYTVLAITGAAALGYRSTFEALVPTAGVLLPVVGAAIVLLPTVCLFRNVLAPVPGASTDQTVEPFRPRAMMLLVSVAFWTAAPVTLWAFAELAAVSRQLAPAGVAHALALSSLIGIAGSIVPAMIGRGRPSNRAMVVAGTAGLLAGTALSLTGGSATLLGLGLSLSCICWNVTTIYQLAGLTGIDRSGRSAALCAPAQLIGTAIGPPVAGQLISWYGNTSLLTLIFAMAASGAALAAMSLRDDHEPEPQAHYPGSEP